MAELSQAQVNLITALWDYTGGDKAKILTADQTTILKTMIEEVRVFDPNLARTVGEMTACRRIFGWDSVDIELFEHASGGALLRMLSGERYTIPKNYFTNERNVVLPERCRGRSNRVPGKSPRDTKAVLAEVVAGRHWTWLNDDQAKDLVAVAIADRNCEANRALFCELACDPDDFEACPTYVVKVNPGVLQKLKSRNAFAFEYTRTPDWAGQCGESYGEIELYPCSGDWLLYVRHLAVGDGTEDFDPPSDKYRIGWYFDWFWTEEYPNR